MPERSLVLRLAAPLDAEELAGDAARGAARLQRFVETGLRCRSMLRPEPPIAPAVVLWRREARPRQHVA